MKFHIIQKPTGIGRTMVEIIFQKLQKATMDIIFVLASIFIFVVLNVKS